jgi:hypothetical protein
LDDETTKLPAPIVTPAFSYLRGQVPRPTTEDMMAHRQLAAEVEHITKPRTPVIG